jgi:glyoxylate reductase
MANRVLVTHPMPGGLDLLDGFDLVHPPEPPTRPALLEFVADVDGLVCPLTVRVDAELLDAAASLRVVGNVAVGYDNVDVGAATERGVVVTNTPGVLDETTADLTFALILAACRLLSDAERDLRAGRWDGWALDQFLGVDVHGATLGLVGYGRIGRAVARRATGFDMTVSHHTRTPTGEPGHVPDLDDLLRDADVVSLHVPLTAQTRHLIGARELGVMKETAVLVNTARGPIVDEQALAAALEHGTVFAAGLDVYEDEPRVHPRLLRAPRTVLLPHIGSASRATRTRMARIAQEAVRDALEGRLPEVAVNPEAWRSRRPGQT